MATETLQEDDGRLYRGGPPLSVEERSSLLASLEADLIGPFATQGEELLHLPPSRWYLTGFLSPQAAREIEDPTQDEELAAGSELDDEESPGAEPEPKQRNRFPASMRMSVLLSPRSSSDSVVATVSYAEYVAESLQEEEGKKPRQVWR